MSRGRLLPSLNYRSKGVIDISVNNTLLRNAVALEVYGASNLNDAFLSPRLMFSVLTGRTHVSPSLKNKRLHGQEDTKRDQTRLFFSLDDYATTPQAGATRLPPDSDVVYLRLRAQLNNGTFTDFGPISII